MFKEQSIISDPSTGEFDTTLVSVLDHGTSTAKLSVSFSDWHGRHDITASLGGKNENLIFYFSPAEARDLAANLYTLANHIDEEEMTK